MLNGEVLVTGAAGFIGFHVAQQMLKAGRRVVGLDNLNNYYDPKLKEARLSLLKIYPAFEFVKADISDDAAMKSLFAERRFPIVVHLAAQAGVRYSLTNPQSYIESNIRGFANILEGCRESASQHLLFASSSSVYGSNTKLPFSVRDRVDHPISLYAASKRANELMAHSYSHLFGLPTTGLRFFTVYGPWGRPDMAMFIFAKAILEGQPIKLYNAGNILRDFTYVDDVSEAIVRLVDVPASRNPDWNGDDPDPATSSAPWKIYNVGNNKPEKLLHVVALLEKHFGRVAIKEFLPMQPGDVPATYANVDDIIRDIDFRPCTSIERGVERFAQWYREYRLNEKIEV